MKIEDIKTKADQLAEKMNNITNSFSKNADCADEMTVEGDELLNLVNDVIDVSNKDVMAVVDGNKNSGLVTRTEALNLKTLIDDFSYVRGMLKTNADAGRRIMANLTLSILNVDDDDEHVELSDKALLISAFADINKSVAVNMDLYLKTYKEISTILLQLDKIKDTQDSITGEKTDKPEKEINTCDLIKQLNTIEE